MGQAVEAAGGMPLDEFVGYVAKKGGFHGAHVTSILHDAGNGTMSIRLDDVNATLRGGPGYQGKAGAWLLFRSVTDVDIDLAGTDASPGIDEMELGPEGEGTRAVFALIPSGQVAFTFHEVLVAP